ncbi:hypothetical protein HON58_02850, partial [Candidatus Peregrinibacteria bacterium]|nr:hypothetical protein [Candidatus Peregrinibacteria bacterium]
MNEYQEILEQHLEDAESSSSLEDYVGSFRDFVKVIKRSASLSPFIRRLSKEKAYCYRPVQLAFRKMHIKITGMINAISTTLESDERLANALSSLHLACPLPIKIFLKNLQDPFFDSERLFRKYTEDTCLVFQSICNAGMEEL